MTDSLIIDGSLSAHSALRQQIENEIKNFENIDFQIKESTDTIQNSKSAISALQEAMKLSYIILNYKATLIYSLNSIRDSYKNFDDSLKPKLKSQETLILQRLENLRDLHSSLELIQRLSYSNRIQ